MLPRGLSYREVLQSACIGRPQHRSQYLHLEDLKRSYHVKHTVVLITHPDTRLSLELPCTVPNFSDSHLNSRRRDMIIPEFPLRDPAFLLDAVRLDLHH